MKTDAQKVAEGLSELQRSALVPFMCFSDKTGREMKRLGLLMETDGVWNHADFGMKVRALLREKAGG